MNTRIFTLFSAFAILQSITPAFGVSPTEPPITKRAPAEMEPLFLVVGEESYTLNDEQMTLESLNRYFNTTQLNAEQSVKLQVNRTVEYERIKQVLNILHKNGLKNISVVKGG